MDYEYKYSRNAIHLIDDVSGGPTRIFERYVFKYLARDSEALANGNGYNNYSKGNYHYYIRNTFAHTYTSASWDYDWGRTIATKVANAHEDADYL